MQRNTVLLVNPNRMLPPVAPIGLDYVAAELVRNGSTGVSPSHRGFEPVLCDLTFADDWQAALTHALRDTIPLAVGFTVRNIDDAYFASQDFILERTTAMIRHVQSITDCPIVLGGVGFSCAPREVLQYTGADYGIAGEGEQAFPLLLRCLQTGSGVSRVPGLVFRLSSGSIVANDAEPCDLRTVPAPTRRFADNVRYFAEGGQAGIETKRGCASACIYCVDPVSKGRSVRRRPPIRVAQEFEDLLEQGINVVHLCDSEFNLPADHARAVCEAISGRGLSSKLRWYAYLSPRPFDADLARAMARAGCAGINFGADHADSAMLERLGRNFEAEDIQRAVEACRGAGIAVMLDLLFGGPGETRETIARTIEFVRKVEPDCAGLSCGVRVYPHTPLAEQVRAQGALHENPNLHGAVRDNPDFLRPIFFVDAQVGGPIHGCVTSLVDGDKRFFHADPAQIDGNYNYNNNSILANAIRNGARGAYWDILRRLP